MKYRMLLKIPMGRKRKAKKERKIRKIKKMTKMIARIKKMKEITIIYVRKSNNFRCKNKMKLYIKNKGWELSMTKKCFFIKITSLVIPKDQKEFKRYISILLRKSKYYF